MLDLRHIHPLTDFKRDTAAFRRTLKKSGIPAVLTVEGRPELVVQDAGAYQALLDELERTRAIAGIRAGLDSMSRGEGRSLASFDAGMRRKYGITQPKPRRKR